RGGRDSPNGDRPSHPPMKDRTESADDLEGERMQQADSIYRCRFCDQPLRYTFVDLGLSPLCESYVAAADLGEPEQLYPLHSFVCERCFLVQLPEHVTASKIFE